MTTYYTEDHEWVRVEGDVATIGITDHAQDQLGDIVFVELPEVDAELEKGDDACVVESVKAAGDVHNPVSGTVIEVNESLEDEPALVNQSPESDGWIYKIKLSDASEVEDLMDADAYQSFIA